MGMATTRTGTSETPCGEKDFQNTTSLIVCGNVRNIGDVTGAAASYVPQDGRFSLLVNTLV